jgi:bacillithiol system protein YtxJ
VLKAAEAVHAHPTTHIISGGKTPQILYMVNWITLTDIEQLTAILENSYKKPQVLFKHSTRCSVSGVALKRMEKAGITSDADFYFIDLVSFRKISDKIANYFDISHESPQILLIKNGECIYDESHLGITLPELSDQIFSLTN